MIDALGDLGFHVEIPDGFGSKISDAVRKIGEGISKKRTSHQNSTDEDLDQELPSEQILISVPIPHLLCRFSSWDFPNTPISYFLTLWIPSVFPVRPKRSKKFSTEKTAASRMTTAFGAETKGEQHKSNLRRSY